MLAFAGHMCAYNRLCIVAAVARALCTVSLAWLAETRTIVNRNIPMTWQAESLVGRVPRSRKVIRRASLGYFLHGCIWHETAGGDGSGSAEQSADEYLHRARSVFSMPARAL